MSFYSYHLLKAKIQQTKTLFWLFAVCEDSLKILVCLLRTICCDLRKLTLHCKNVGGKQPQNLKKVHHMTELLFGPSQHDQGYSSGWGYKIFHPVQKLSRWFLTQHGKRRCEGKPRSNITTFPIRGSCVPPGTNYHRSNQTFSFNWFCPSWLWSLAGFDQVLS